MRTELEASLRQDAKWVLAIIYMPGKLKFLQMMANVHFASCLRNASNSVVNFMGNKHLRQQKLLTYKLFVIGVFTRSTTMVTNGFSNNGTK